jgi:3-isopropylmalate/(R)-2-methylmalate dehydratase large subunit
VKVDLALAHDGTGPEILTLFEKNSRGVARNSRVLITLDHAFPAPTIADRQFQKDIQEFARHNKINLYKNGEGVLHQVVAENESLWPGMIIVGADGHVATAGAFGAIAFSVRPGPFVQAVCEGVYHLSVPEQVVVSLEGILRSHVMARDVAFHLIRHHGDEIEDKAVVLTGSAVDKMNISEKMTLCNLLPESKVRTVLVLPQGEKEKVDITLAAHRIEPMLALPSVPVKIVRPHEWERQKITVAIAGGCSSGRLDDMQVIADVLSKNEVHQDVTFIITPGSRSIMGSMDRMDLSTTLRNSGAVIMPPGCGPCPGKHLGVLTKDDVAITTTPRNSPGRIGSSEAKIYLASPLTVALSAVHGQISEPTEMM